MFLKYMEPLFRPWRALRTKLVKVRTVRGNIHAEGRRVERFGRLARQQEKRLQKLANHGPRGEHRGQPSENSAGASDTAGAWNAARLPGQPAATAPSAPVFQPTFVPSENPPILIKGFFFKRRSCTQCQMPLPKDWDRCMDCLHRYRLYKKMSSPKQLTQAMRIACAGGGNPGWLVPIVGTQRGELYTLAPQNVIGNDVSCNIVLKDPYMSSRHIEIVQREGIWTLRDLGSKNGTLVNDTPVVEHELVDSDFIGIGRSVIKFKCLIG